MTRPSTERLTRIRIARILSLDGPQGIHIEEQNAPKPKPGEVLLDMEALGLNRAEAMFARGQYLVEPRLPNPIGVEGVGRIRALGPGVSGFEPGQRVGVFAASDMHRYGVAAEQIAVPTEMLLPDVPGHSDESMAAFWMAYLTAHCGMVQSGRLSRGETVLITAASSSVGLAAIQVARRAGARAVAATRSKRKEKALLDAGADRVVVMDDTPLSECGENFDLAFDAVGAPILAQLGDLMRPKGRIIVYGILSGTQEAPFPLFAALFKDISMRAFHLVHHALSDQTRRDEAFQSLLNGVREGAFHPALDRIFPFSEITSAYARLESSDQVGKIVVRMKGT
ncbi:MAG: zinc-dependent alcohol dehydrogenase family protein [Myxococcota bacterium]